MDENKNTDSASASFTERYRSIIKHSETVRTFRTKTGPSDGTSASHTDGNSDRVREFDPRSTYNPAAQHQISTKKIDSKVSEDTKMFPIGGYEKRFEPAPELASGGTKEIDLGLYGGTVEGQQSFPEELFASVKTVKRGIRTDVQPEAQTDDSAGDSDDGMKIASDINEVYSILEKQESFAAGKSEHLRAIARTAAEDRTTDSGSQLSFPGFETEEERKIAEETVQRNLSTTRSDMVDKFMLNGGVQTSDDSLVPITDITDEDEKKPVRSSGFAAFQKSVTDFIHAHEDKGDSPKKEYDSPDKKDEVNAYIGSLLKKNFARLAVSGISAVVLLILSLISSAMFGNGVNTFMNGNTKLYAAVNFAVLAAVYAVCLPDLARGFRMVKKKHFTSELAVSVMFLFSFVQTAAVFFIPQSLNVSARLLAPAALFSAALRYAGKYLAALNMQQLFAGHIKQKGYSIMRSFGDNSIAVEMIEDRDVHSDVRYAAKTKFVSGFVKSTLNSVPAEPHGELLYVICLVLSVITGLVTLMISSDFAAGITAAAGAVIISVPVSYALNAIIPLIRENKRLSVRQSAVLSYGAASDISGTTGIVFDASDIIAQEHCNIHGMKTFNGFDPATASVYAAAIAIGAKTPLEGIFRKVMDISEMTLPETENLDYEERLGFATWIDDKRVLFGSEDIMKNHTIPLPEADIIADAGDCRIIYLAVGDRLAAVFFVSYHIRRSTAQFLRQLSDHGLSVLISSNDQNVNESYIESVCRLPADRVRVIPSRVGSYYREMAEKVTDAENADVICGERLTDWATVYDSSFRLTSWLRAFACIYIVGAVIGIILVAMLAFSGNPDSIGSLQIILFRIIWLAIGLGCPYVIRK